MQRISKSHGEVLQESSRNVAEGATAELEDTDVGAS